MTTPIDIRMHVVAHVPSGWNAEKYHERCVEIERYIRGKDRTMDEPLVALYETTCSEWKRCCEELERDDFPSNEALYFVRGRREALNGFLRSIEYLLNQDRKL